MIACAALPAYAAIAQVQAVSTQASAVTSITAPFPASTTAGNLIIALVRASTTTQTITVQDTARNVYTDAVMQAQSTDGHQIHIFYAKNIAGGPDTITATFSGANNHPWLSIYEYSGLSATSPLDRTARAQGSSTAANSGPTAATSTANELVFAALGLPATSSVQVSAGAGYALLQQDGPGGTSRAATESQTVAAAGSFSGTFTLSSAANWTAVVATFVAAGQATAPAVTTASLPSGTVNSSYSSALTASGGSPPYTWSIIFGSLPSGLALNSGSGAISGTPTTAGTSSFTVQVSDSASQTAAKALGITINPQVASGIALVQSAALQGSGVSSLSQAFPASNTAGNLIIAAVRMSSTSQSVTLTDTAGNSYLDAVTQAQTTDGHQIHVFYVANIKGGANAVTATFSAANNHPWLAIYEYSGLNPTAPLDQTARAQGNGTAPSSGATAGQVVAGELLFAVLGLPSGSSAAVSSSAGYTLELQDSIAGGSRAAGEDGFAAASGAYSADFTLTAAANWSCALATFRSAATVALVSLAVTPTSASIAAGSTQQFTATGTMSDGSTVNLTRAVTWSSSAPAVATVSASGLASATAAGTAIITATSGSVHGPATLNVSGGTSAVQHYEYVFPEGSMYVYDMDNAFALVKQISLPQAIGIRGVSVNPSTSTMYISYGGDGGSNGNGSMLAYNLLTDQVMWTANYAFGIDSMAITPNGGTIYMPIGEASSGTAWNILNASNGSMTGSISAGAGPHNTVVSLDGANVYMGPRNDVYLVMASTATNIVTRKMGPMLSGVRPFTINGKQTLAFTTATGFLGFQVSSITTGQVLYTVPVAGFTTNSNFQPSALSHGVSLSPDEKEVWVMDGPNSYVHVFDVTGLPGSPPKQVADLPLSRPITGTKPGCPFDCLREGWVHHSKDGRFVFIGDSGDVFSTATRQRVVNLDPLYNTRVHLEIDWQNGVPIATTTRQGMGYVTQ